LLLTVLAALAEFERVLIAERVRGGWRARAGTERGSVGIRDGAPHVVRELPGVLSRRAAARRPKVGMGTLLDVPKGRPSRSSSIEFAEARGRSRQAFAVD
jgi:hypothetical protein